LARGTATNAVSFAGWPTNDYSGTAGILPNSSWPAWNPATGVLTSGSTTNINEEIFALTPAQNINRLVVTKQSVSGWSTDITFVSADPTLSLRLSGANVILTWPTNYTGYGLQSTTNLNPPAAWSAALTAPVIVNGLNTVTNALAGHAQFFRLTHP
jgi:hypothetical protein